MRKEYNFTKAQKNPYTKKLKTRLTIRLDEDVVQYFQKLADEHEIPYQTLINFYLRDCSQKKLKPNMSWKKKK